MRKFFRASAILFLALPFASAALAAKPLSAAQIERQGPFIGQISNGQCICKADCDRALSIFTENGRTAAQCYRKCETAFSGCSVGEIRERSRRDL